MGASRGSAEHAACHAALHTLPTTRRTHATVNRLPSMSPPVHACRKHMNSPQVFQVSPHFRELLKMWPKEGCTPVLGAKLLSLLVAFRVFNALLVRTSFTPDEFWQGPEPAHLLAFGKGHLTWEWEPSARIRGFTHPLIFAGVYKVLQMVGLDTRWAVAHSPKLLQGVMAGVCDYYAFGLALRAFGASAAGWALLFQVLSWFNFYCLVRPYSNSAEAVLATAALFYWAPFFLPSGTGGGSGGGGSGTRDGTVRGGGGGGKGARRALQETLALVLAALCVAVRPTSAALWALVGLLRLSTLPLRNWPRYLTLTVLPPVAAVVGASFCLDSWLYGAATLVPLNFLRFNVLEGKSRIFGEQAWHWNFSQGLPAVLGAALPAALWGFWRPLGGIRGLPGCGGGGGGRRLGWLAVWFLVYHSTSPHKEFRFLLPILPIAHAYAGQAVSAFLAAKSSGKGKEPAETSGDSAGASKGSAKVKSDNRDNASVIGATKRAVKSSSNGSGSGRGGGGGGGVGSSGGGSSSSSSGDSRGRRRAVITAALFLLHAPAAVYLSVWHQSGALSAVDVVANRVPALALAKTGTGGGANLKREGKSATVAVHFLMPCHSAPLHSHLHFRNLETSLWSLDCSPKNRELPGGSESDKFQSDPLAFLQSTYGGAGETEEVGDGSSSPLLPDLAVIYSTHLDRAGVADYLAALGLENVQVVFNAHVNGDADSDDTHRSVAILERAGCQPGDGQGSPRSCSL